MFLKEIRKYLQKVLNFTIVLKTPNEGTWGNLSDNKTWNGMILDLLNDEIDICTSGLTITFDRAEASDFRYLVGYVQGYTKITFPGCVKLGEKVVFSCMQ